MNSFVPLFNLATAVSPEDPSFQVSIVTPTTKVSGRLWSCECDGVTSSAVCGEFLTGTTKPVTLKPPLQHLQQGKLFPTQPAPCHSLGTECRCQHFAWSIPCHCRIWHHLWVSVIEVSNYPCNTPFFTETAKYIHLFLTLFSCSTAAVAMEELYNDLWEGTWFL